MLKALIFDVDGTLADTEQVHLAAFNLAFAELGMGWHWDEALYTRLLEVSGGKERILAYWKEVNPNIQSLDGTALKDTIDRVHELKTAAYEQAVNSGAVQLRSGVLGLMSMAHQAGLRLAIATTTSPVNIAALLRHAIGPDWGQYFSVIEDASTAPQKKPHPQVYLQTLQGLGLQAHEALAFEDSGNGLRAALAAGLATIVTPTSFTAHHDFQGAARVLPGLDGLTLDDLENAHTTRTQP